jgi:hypothetical protein
LWKVERCRPGHIFSCSLRPPPPTGGTLLPSPTCKCVTRETILPGDHMPTPFPLFFPFLPSCTLLPYQPTTYPDCRTCKCAAPETILPMTTCDPSSAGHAPTVIRNWERLVSAEGRGGGASVGGSGWCLCTEGGERVRGADKRGEGRRCWEYKQQVGVEGARTRPSVSHAKYPRGIMPQPKLPPLLNKYTAVGALTGPSVSHAKYPRGIMPQPQPKRFVVEPGAAVNRVAATACRAMGVGVAGESCHRV